MKHNCSEAARLWAQGQQLSVVRATFESAWKFDAEMRGFLRQFCPKLDSLKAVFFGVNMRILSLAAVSLLAGLVAIYSRCFDRSLLDGTMSGLLQNEGRAAIEHLLTAVAFTLAALPVFVLGAASMGIKNLFNRAHTRGDDSESLSGERAILYAILCTALLGPFSVALDFMIEVDQAYRGIGFLSAPRGYMQWEQVFASTVGALLAMGMAWVAFTPVVGRATAVKHVTDELRSLRNSKSRYGLMLAYILVPVIFGVLM